jgi:predicted phosphodiesterase
MVLVGMKKKFKKTSPISLLFSLLILVALLRYQMRAIFRTRWLVMLILVPVIVSCYSFIGEYGEPFYDGKCPAYFEKLVDESFYPESLGPNFRCILAKEEDLHVLDESLGFRGQCLAADVILRFVWLSDVHIRQKDVKLFSDKASRTFDKIIQTFEHNDVQEDYHWAVYASLIAAINKLYSPKDFPIDFMIHTGDSIDAGTIEELYKFVYISNHLEIPWLNVVGNHDISIFGNYEERLGYTRKAGVNFYPVGDFTNFVIMQGKYRMFSGFGRHLLPVPTGGHDPSEGSVPGGDKSKIPSTYYHGFDYYERAVPDPPDPNVFAFPHVSGYYAFDIDSTAVPIRVIVLNSAKTESWGADGEISERQRIWLQQKIDSAQGRLLLIFSHHRPLEFDEKTMEVLYQKRSGAMVFFTGHEHKHNVKRYDNQKGQEFYELNTGSILEYPQLGRLIEIRRTKEGKICLVSRSLWTSHFDQNPNISCKDFSCDNKPDMLRDCQEKREQYRSSLSKAASCGHNGSFKDYCCNKEILWGKPQPIEAALKAANIILPIRYDQ